MTGLRHHGCLDLGGCPIEGHFGLVLDKLATRFKGDNGTDLDKDEILRRLMGFATVPMGPGKEPELRPKRQRRIGQAEEALLAKQHARLDALVQGHGRSRRYETLGPLAIGLGNSSPLENGITIHPTYGVPFIPGSAIKGMVGAWAEDWEGYDEAALVRLLGHAPGERDARRIGGVTFHDALPLPPTRVVVDVMTPHAGPYYGDAPLPPADWHSPNPIPFIAVPKGQHFGVRYHVNGRADLGRATLMDLVEEIDRLLLEAFATIGIGAKTAAGYGRLAPPA